MKELKIFGSEKMLNLFTAYDENPKEYIESCFDVNYSNVNTNYENPNQLYKDLKDPYIEWTIEYNTDDEILTFFSSTNKFVEFYDIDEDEVNSIFTK